ncbi:hypothetical protein BSR29_07000 [Boudabousia liubingyangii]|uniref:Mechanosensitive ion channel MscS domain-containing protein n=1 Tax=Boudabousia liubingyangii TaxID=1921764 RepID=A0A1Q5PK26_9ACTO|nr:mechanosensitive ion channel domain-containing protein [Boudabousia liubingyangii]OKL46568.1 hypothetical protein BSR29_07000 [Boudabousia liubingyangii]OKL46848.1 hypothetical protein BSR28_05290 [Boudabousia liubingyangii]
MALSTIIPVLQVALPNRGGWALPNFLRFLEKDPATPEGVGKATEKAVEATVDIATIIGSAAFGAFIGLLVGIVIFVIVRLMLSRTKPGQLLAHRLRLPIPILVLIIGASIGVDYGEMGVSIDNAPWIAVFQHGMILAIIAAATWVLLAAAHVIEDIAVNRYGDSTGGRARRVTTQTQVLRRVLQAIIFSIGVIVALLTFPAARTGMTALLSSAGIISIVAGIAAQSVLGNMFAGLQVAFTDSVRVGDILLFEGQYGTVEEITLTYVVLRLWDEKRLIIPSKMLTEKSIENWTRRHTRVLGTVELPMDWSAPLPALRLEMQRLLANTDLWDGETATIQCTDAPAGTLLVRVCVSADNPSNLWDLRCYLREHLVDWTVRNAPYALIRTRFQQQEVQHVENRESDADIARLAEELAMISGGNPAPETNEANQEITADQTSVLVQHANQVAGGKADPFVVARLKAARNRSKRERSEARKRRAKIQQAEGNLARIERERAKNPVEEVDLTTVLSPEQIRALQGQPVEATSAKAKPEITNPSAAEKSQKSAQTADLPVAGRNVVDTDPAQERLYSGSPEAEERARAMSGPGPEALAEREANIRRQQAEAQAREEELRHGDPNDPTDPSRPVGHGGE